jgi:hypothetical protein
MIMVTSLPLFTRSEEAMDESSFDCYNGHERNYYTRIHDYVPFRSTLPAFPKQPMAVHILASHSRE